MNSTMLIPVIQGIESVVREELAELGYRSVALQNGRVLLETEFNQIPRLNAALRTAERILLVILKLEVSSLDELFDAVSALDLSWLVPSNARFTVVAKSKGSSSIRSEVTLQRAIKKALVNTLLRTHRVSMLPENGPHFPFHVSVDGDEAILALDTTGEGLHRRGYRLETGEAPLKETLAAALIRLSGWQPAECPLVDPCCGSGTILIEAARPASTRRYLHEEWNLFDQKDYRPPLPPKEPVLIGSDRDEAVIRIARANADRAGVEVNFTAGDISQCRSKDSVIISNPPYGERLKADLKTIYRGFHRLIDDNRALHVLTADRELEKHLRLPAKRRRKLSSGGMRVDFYTF